MTTLIVTNDKSELVDFITNCIHLDIKLDIAVILSSYNESRISNLMTLKYKHNIKLLFEPFADLKTCELQKLIPDLDIYGVNRWELQKAFIPEIFPDYDNYLFIDANVELKSVKVKMNFIQLCNNGKLYVVPEMDRALLHNNKYFNYALNFSLLNYTKYFGNKAATIFNITRFPLLSNDIFAVSGKSRLWKIWQDNLTVAILTNKVPEKGIDKISFNFSIYNDNISREYLPLTYNWLAKFLDYSNLHDEYCHINAPHESIMVMNYNDLTIEEKLDSVDGSFNINPTDIFAIKQSDIKSITTWTSKEKE